jgi:hypothetical protein
MRMAAVFTLTTVNIARRTEIVSRWLAVAGLRADEAMARFFWDAHAAAVVCDNPAVEVVPGDATVGSLHRRLIPLLGLALGEMFDLETLAQRCGAAGRWTFMFVAVPLKVPGAIGSPGNAVAIL